MPARKKAEGETAASPKKRATRSKGEPSPLKRQGTMDKTASEAEKYLGRGTKKRGRPSSRSASPKKTATKRAASSSPKKKKVSPKKIKRQGTMAVTAAEGEKFVDHESTPKKKSPSPKRKSPSPKKKSPSPKKAKKEEPKKIKRQGTMAVTAAEGGDFLAKEDEKEKEKEEEEKEDDEDKPKKRGAKKKDDSPSKLKRQGTMAVTATEGQAFVKKSPGRKASTRGKKN